MQAKPPANTLAEDCRKFLQGGRILCRNFSAPRQISFQLRELLKSQRAGDVGQSVIEAEQNHLVVPLAFTLAFAGLAADSVIAKFSQSIGKSGIIGRDHSAFTRGQMFHGMKTENRHVRDASHAAAAILRAQRMAGIFDDGQPVAVGDLQQFIEIGGMPCVIDRQQRFGART